MARPGITKKFLLHVCFIGIFGVRVLSGADASALPVAKPELEFIRVAKDGRHFEGADSNIRFKPWGFNYDHDAAGRLLETYWKEEWSKVVRDSAEIKRLGANTVRIHLQLAHFMKTPKESNRESFKQLARLVTLAETNHLYLDLTGLGCYDKKDVPSWYSDLNESERWNVQARFWKAVATTCADSPAIFCYDLMNEPIVTEDKTGHDWTPGAFGGFYYVQRLTLDFAGRTPEAIAEAWVNQMVAAIRSCDQQHLITVGAIPWALTFPGAKPLFYSKTVSKNLDFVSLHFYPKTGEMNQALTALAVYQIGKPIVIEEVFPLNCSVAELDQFIVESQTNATGWIGFFWGKSIEDYHREKIAGIAGIAESLTLDWLEYFVKKTPEILNR